MVLNAYKLFDDSNLKASTVIWSHPFYFGMSHFQFFGIKFFLIIQSVNLQLWNYYIQEDVSLQYNHLLLLTVLVSLVWLSLNAIHS